MDEYDNVIWDPNKKNTDVKKHGGGFKNFVPYNKLSNKQRVIMKHHCIVLLSWASKHRNNEVSITILSNETGIPRMSISWILKDYRVRKQDSVLYKIAQTHNYNFIVYKNWNTSNKYKRRKLIIDAVKNSEPFNKCNN
ncbi:MAG: hypothetical protein WC175_03035 [Candidatus Dojkabacteria bacterium]